MNAKNYAGWSLRDLKEAAADLDVAALDTHAKTFARGEQALQSVQESFASALGFLAGGWSGTAAQAAAGNAQSSISRVSSAQEQAALSRSQTQAYLADTRSRQAQIAAIPDVDTGWGNAFASGALGGLAGVGLAKYQQQQEYERQRAKAARLVEQIDGRGEQQAGEMMVHDWLTPSATKEKPSALRPPAHRRDSPGDAASRPQNVSNETTGNFSASRDASGDPGGEASSGSGAAGGADEPAPRPSGSGGVAPTATSEPTTATPVPLPTVPHQPAAATSSPDAGGVGLAGGAAVAAGGAALAAGSAGRASGLRPLAEPSTIGATPAYGNSPRSTGALEQGAAGGKTAGGPGGFRSGAGTGVRAGVPEPGPPGTGSAAARAASAELPVRPGGSPSASGYPPVAPAAQRREEDDELKARPEYLVEPDDIWGDGRLASPPVLG